MWPPAIVMLDPQSQCAAQMGFRQRYEPVQTLSTYGANDPFATYRANCRRKNRTSACSAWRDRNPSATHLIRSVTTCTTMETKRRTPQSCHTRAAEPPQDGRTDLLRMTGIGRVRPIAADSRVRASGTEMRANRSLASRAFSPCSFRSGSRGRWLADERLARCHQARRKELHEGVDARTVPQVGVCQHPQGRPRHGMSSR